MPTSFSWPYPNWMSCSAPLHWHENRSTVWMTVQSWILIIQGSKHHIWTDNLEHTGLAGWNPKLLSCHTKHSPASARYSRGGRKRQCCWTSQTSASAPAYLVHPETKKPLHFITQTKMKSSGNSSRRHGCVRPQSSKAHPTLSSAPRANSLPPICWGSHSNRCLLHFCHELSRTNIHPKYVFKALHSCLFHFMKQLLTIIAVIHMTACPTS